jgi:ubiquinone/menaquinone biosynthesis C-methylase UbiE
MGKDDYLLSHTAEAFERERLALLERQSDPVSQRHLAALGIQQGWHCLEVGAGHGSVARWLAGQAGAQGRVVATDINPRFLKEIEIPNLELRQHDIRIDPLEPEMYDLAHCRALLMHLTQPLQAVRRIVAALRIGGWLLVEEPDNSSIRAVDNRHPQTAFFNRKIQEIYERVSDVSGANAYFSARIRGLLEEAGLTDVGNEGVARISQGGELDARMRSMSLQVFMERGLVSQTECVELQRVCNDPSFSYITATAFASWGKRAA